MNRVFSQRNSCCMAGSPRSARCRNSANRPVSAILTKDSKCHLTEAELALFALFRMEAFILIGGGSLTGITVKMVVEVLLNGLVSSPALEQVCDSPVRGELVADAVGVDLLNLCRALGGQHHVAGVNGLPDTRS